MLALAIGGFALWPLTARQLVPGAAEYMNSLAQWNVEQVRGPSFESLAWLIRNAGWYTWPLWPFALWTLYSWRSFLRRPHVLLPLLVAAAGLLNVLLSSNPSDRELIVVVPALVLMAAFGVSTLRRAADNAIDWFSIALFVLALIGAWLYFIAWNTGTPPKMAASVARFVPGLVPDFDLVAAIVALAATSRLGGARGLASARAPADAVARTGTRGGGPDRDVGAGRNDLREARSSTTAGMRPTATVLGDQVRRLAGPGACVQAYQLPMGMRAMLAYHGAIRFSGQGDDSDACRIVIHRDSRRTQLDDAPPIGDWQLAYEATRRARYDEVFRIWVRRP